MRKKLHVMKGLDTFPNPKETKIGKLIYNLKKPVKSRILEEEYDTFDIKECEYRTPSPIYALNGDEYIHKPKNFLTDNILYCSLEDLAEDSDHEDDAVINIRPRSRNLHSISEVSLSDDSIEAISPPRSPPRDREKDFSQEHYHPSNYVVEDNELEMYLQPNHINTLQQYNYAHLDASKLLNKVGNMKEVKSTNHHIPVHRARLGSTPVIVHHSQEFVDAKHPNACKSRSHDAWNRQPANSCECTMAEKIKRSRSVDEILFSHARNSSSYNKFKKSKCTEPTCRFAKYIRINNVEYKVPSNVPKHDPPDLEPAPTLPPKKRCSSKITQECRLDASTAKIKDVDTAFSDVVEPQPTDTQPAQTTKDFDIEEKLEELENMIKELRRCEKEKEDNLVECPTYVNDSTYLDLIRQKRRQKLSNNMSLFRNRFESCPCSSSNTYNNLGSDNQIETFSSATLPHTNKKKCDKPLVVPNSYVIKMDSPQPVRTNDTHNYELFISVRKGKANNKNEIYSTPSTNYTSNKILSNSKNNSSPSSDVKQDDYLYAHPLERNLKEKTDYQYAYGHTQHLLHPVVKRDASCPTIKTVPHSTYGKFHYTRSNVNACDVTDRGKSATYENIKCFGNTPETAPTDINNNIDKDNLLQVPQFDVNETVHRLHEYAYVTPSCELKRAANSTSTQQPSGTNKSKNDTLSLGRVGSSYNKFQSKVDYLLPNGRFAKYVNVEGSDLEYKIPSNVPKFNPPELTPPNVLFKDKSHVNYENPVQLRFSSDNIDEMISEEKNIER